MKKKVMLLSTLLCLILALMGCESDEKDSSEYYRRKQL